MNTTAKAFFTFVLGGIFAMLVILAIVPEEERHTTVTLNKGVVNFRSNCLQKYETFTLIIDGDTVSTGVVVDGQWK